AGQASPVTRGYNGDTGVAAETLYRTPIVTNGVTVGSIVDNGRKQTGWAVTGDEMYFGVLGRNNGAKPNAADWTLFDRRVLLLLGRDPLGPPPSATPVPGR